MRKYTKENYITVSLIITLIIGAILRFKGLLFQSYWLDELTSAGFSNPENSFSTMYNMTVHDTQPPLYQTLLWIWFHIVGFTELAGRSLSAIIGSISVYAIYLLGKELFNKQVGVYASIIASTNYFLIFYSQMVRSYSLLFLLSILSYVYLIRTLNNYTKRDYFTYLFFTIALVYTHYFGVILVATQVLIFIYYFAKEEKKRKLLATLAAVAAITIVTSMLPLIENVLRLEGTTSFWILKPSIIFFKSYFRAYFQSKPLAILFLIMLLLAVSSLFHKGTSIHKKTAVIILMVWIFVGYLLPYLRSITATPLLTERNTIIVLPALIVFIAYGISLIMNGKLRYSLLSVIVILSISQLYNMEYYSKINKEQWREVLFEVSKSKTDLPAYDLVFSVVNYKTYASMLHINLDIRPIEMFQSQYKTESLPSCFWVLEAHGDWISKSKELKDESIYQVLEIQKHQARGILYAYGVKTSICKEKFGVVA